MDNNNREVIFAVSHELLFVPIIKDLGQFGPTLTSTDTAKTKGMKMTLIDDCVALEIKGYTILVPKSNFKLMVLGPKKG